MPDPVLFAWGLFSVRWYGVMVVIGMALGVFLACLEAKRQELDAENYFNMSVFSLIAGILGARAYYVAFNWDYYGANPIKILAFTEGGLAIHGGLIAGSLVFALSGILYHIGGWRSVDIAAPSAVLAQAIGRWGNFFNQEAFGYPVSPGDVPWAMWIAGEYRHPTFLYESLWDLLVFLILLWFRRRKKILDGDVFLLYLTLYSAGRFYIEGFRMDSLMLGEFRVAQLVSVAAIVLSLLVMAIRHRRNNQGEKITNIR